MMIGLFDGSQYLLLERPAGFPSQFQKLGEFVQGIVRIFPVDQIDHIEGFFYRKFEFVKQCERGRGLVIVAVFTTPAEWDSTFTMFVVATFFTLKPILPFDL
jgi:hypothetical protein